MAWKAHIPSSVPFPHTLTPLRVGTAAAQCLAAVLVIICLGGFLRPAVWTAGLDALLAESIRFALGRTPPFVLSGLLLFSAWRSLFRPERPGGIPRVALRVTGAVVIIAAGCSLMNLLHTSGADDVRAFDSGGLLGAFVVSGNGLGLAERMQRHQLLAALVMSFVPALLMFFGLPGFNRSVKPVAVTSASRRAALRKEAGPDPFSRAASVAWAGLGVLLYLPLRVASAAGSFRFSPSRFIPARKPRPRPSAEPLGTSRVLGIGRSGRTPVMMPPVAAAPAPPRPATPPDAEPPYEKVLPSYRLYENVTPGSDPYEVFTPVRRAPAALVAPVAPPRAAEIDAPADVLDQYDEKYHDEDYGDVDYRDDADEIEPANRYAPEDSEPEDYEPEEDDEEEKDIDEVRSIRRRIDAFPDEEEHREPGEGVAEEDAASRAVDRKLREYFDQRSGDHTPTPAEAPPSPTRPAAPRPATPVSERTSPSRPSRPATRSGSGSRPAPVAPPEPAEVYEPEIELADEGHGRVFRRTRKKKPAVPALFLEAEAPEEETEEPRPAPRPYELPPLDLLTDPPTNVYRMTEEEAEALSQRIEETLAQFKIEVEVFEVIQGPTVTRFAMRIAPGIRVNKILALENDMALALRAQQVRILAPIPGQAAVGIEVPNKKTNPVLLKELLEAPAFKESKAILTFALGKNIAGETVIADLGQMPHVLIAGATGAGKSVCLNTIIASLLYRNGPDKLRMIMVDPKRVELAMYQAIPHLMAPVVCEPKKAAAALAWAVEQMENRYKLLAELGVRNIDGYNEIVDDRQPNRKAMGKQLKYMPRMVVVIDELADLMMVAKNEVEEFIIRLAQMARAVGIHLILATQRPSVNVITGIIKANFPSRVAFRVSSKVDSRTILDMNGAEALLGKGDMLYSPGGVKPFRIQGAFVSDAEIESMTDFIRAQEKARYEVEEFDEIKSPAQKAKEQLMKAAMSGVGGPAARGEDEGRAGDDEDDYSAASHASPPPLAVAGRVMEEPLTPADMNSLSDEDLFDIALRLVLESGKGSVSYIQRRLKIGYARAGRVMDMMEERGIVGPYRGSRPREVLMDPADYYRSRNDAEAPADEAAYEQEDEVYEDEDCEYDEEDGEDEAGE